MPKSCSRVVKFVMVKVYVTLDKVVKIVVVRKMNEEYVSEMIIIEIT